MKEKDTSAAWIISVMLLLIALLATYVIAYYLRGEKIVINDTETLRVYSNWEAVLFVPGTIAESAITGRKVYVSSPPSSYE